MMRSAVYVWVVCALARVAAADAKADVAAVVEKHFRAQMGELTQQPEADVEAEASVIDDQDAILVARQPMEPPKWRVWGDLPNGEHPKLIGLTHTPTAIRVVVDAAHHTAYFTAEFDAQWMTPIPESKSMHAPVHGVGVAVQRGKAWKLVAAEYARTLPDAELWKLADPKVKPTTTAGAPDAASGVVLRWFDAHAPIAADRAPLATALARGTAPAESATGVAADKLARQWDAIKMFRRGAVRSHVWGSTAFVEVDVAIPQKIGAVPLALHAILVADGAGAWKWVALDFAAPVPQS